MQLEHRDSRRASHVNTPPPPLPSPSFRFFSTLAVGIFRVTLIPAWQRATVDCSLNIGGRRDGDITVAKNRIYYARESRQARIAPGCSRSHRARSQAIVYRAEIARPSDKSLCGTRSSPSSLIASLLSRLQESQTFS